MVRELPKKNNDLPFTLRKLRLTPKQKKLFASYLLVVVACVVAGPFSTYENLSMLNRLPYWGGVIAACYCIALGILFISDKFEPKSKPLLFLLEMATNLAIGVCIAAFVYQVNLMVWGNIESLPSFTSYLSLTIPITLIISIGFFVFGSKNSLDNETPHDAKKLAPFFKRLPSHLGRQLISISVSDHYVEAVTNKGTHMVLMRFGDALDEVEPIAGLQIHRSHWVALDHIVKTTKRDGKLYIQLSNDELLPVSRGRLAEVKKVLNV